ncbi:MAG: divergent polysaccharide deacetylase family protein, partial [Sneathiella sp.]|nr:divergent polysaccharide deacetylase family protein [Sneathiella sp.]
LNSLSIDEIRQVTLKNLSQFSGYVGVNNHMGSKFTSYEEGMAAVMDILRDKGLLFLDSRTIATSKGHILAKERGVPTVTRDVFIDNEVNEKAILKQLKKVESVALDKGIAIAIGHPHKETIAALIRWMPEAIKKGFHFIPVSTALLSTAAN